MKNLTNIFRRTTVSQRLLIGGAAFLLPVGILLFFSLSAVQRELRSAEFERTGNTLAGILTDLGSLITQHNRLSFRFLDSGDVSSEYLNEIERNIDTAFSDMKEIISRYGTIPVTDEESTETGDISGNSLTALHDRWLTLAGEWRTLTPVRCDSEHSDLLESIMSFLSRLQNSTYHNLDSVSGFYYLTDMVVRIIPETEIRMNQVFLDGLMMLSDTGTGIQDTGHIEITADLIGNHLLVRIKECIGTAINAAGERNSPAPDSMIRLSSAYGEFSSYVPEFMRLVSKMTANPGSVTTDTFINAGERAFEATEQLRKTAGSELDLLLEYRIGRLRLLRSVILLLTVLSLMTAGFILYLVTESITRPLEHMLAVSSQYASAAMPLSETSPDRAASETRTVGHENTGEEQTEDEITLCCKRFMSMSEHLDTLVKIITDTGIAVTSSVNTIIASVSELEKITDEQLSTSSSIDTICADISKTENELTASLSAISGEASETSGIVNSGIAHLNEIDAVLGNLDGNATTISQKLDSVAAVTENINKIITGITKLANQTNMLSLNAAIESEKIGASGSGFSIIADEIRHISDHTAVATQEIGKCIHTVQSETSSCAVFVKEYAEQIRSGREHTSDIEDSFSAVIRQSGDFASRCKTADEAIRTTIGAAGKIGEILDRLRKNTEQAGESLTEISSGVDQLKKAVNSLNHNGLLNKNKK